MFSSDVILPFIASRRLGTGVGVISTSPDVHSVISGMFGRNVGGKRVSSQKMLAHLKNCEKALAAQEELNAKTRETIHRPTVLRIAEVLSGFGEEWIILQHGTAITNIGVAPAINTPEKFADAFECDYPFHRFNDDPHEGLMRCFLRIQSIRDQNLRETASQAISQLLLDGYPLPGRNADRYAFLPRPDIGVVWMADQNMLLGHNEYKLRKSTAEERQCLADVGRTDFVTKIPTYDDPSIDQRISTSPLTVMVLGRIKTQGLSRVRKC